MSRRWGLLVAGVALPGAAAAHSPVPGLGRFYNGMLHPLLAPAPLIALLALGLLIGQRGLATNPRAVLAFALGLALGLGAGASLGEIQVAIVLLAASVVAAGATLAMVEVPPAALAVAAASLGGAAGLGLADAPSGDGRWLVLTGTWLGAALCALGTAALAELATRPWQKVAVRVVASWLAASAILVLTLAWVGPKSDASHSAAPSGPGHAGSGGRTVTFSAEPSAPRDGASAGSGRWPAPTTRSSQTRAAARTAPAWTG